jgi:hypothetical protein
MQMHVLGARAGDVTVASLMTTTLFIRVDAAAGLLLETT